MGSTIYNKFYLIKGRHIYQFERKQIAVINIENNLQFKILNFIYKNKECTLQSENYYNLGFFRFIV